MTTVTIPLLKSLFEQIKGKTIKKSNITENGNFELKIEDYQFWKRTAKIKKEVGDGKGIEVDVDKLGEHFS
ncbi:MAG: hypothetical protein LBD03_05535 [Methanobrevibacter sp.]|nr:hypothetical protein [Candidatus Methanovirga procula]